MIKTISISILSLLTLQIYGQNYIKNFSFEDYKNLIDQRQSNFSEAAEGWKSIKLSADYLNRNLRYCGIPNNFIGTQEALTGDAYMLFFAYDKLSGFPVEVLSTRLKKPLDKDSVYLVEYYVSLTDGSRFAVDSLHFIFSSRPISYSYKNGISEKSNQPIGLNHGRTFLSDMKQWMRVHYQYKANGKERYIAIGCLQEPHISESLNKKGSWKSVSYYVDDVSVTLLRNEKSPISKPLFLSTGLTLNDNEFILPNVNFDSNDSIITPTSFSVINKLCTYLKGNPHLKITINGHTDNLGDKLSNQELSEARARAVVNHLVKNGIHSSRINYRGYGASQAIDTNSSEIGRSQNRRVTVQLTRNDK